MWLGPHATGKKKLAAVVKHPHILSRCMTMNTQAKFKQSPSLLQEARDDILPPFLTPEVEAVCSSEILVSTC